MTITKMVRKAKENNPGSVNQKRSITASAMDSNNNLDQFKFSGNGVKQSSLKSTSANQGLKVTTYESASATAKNTTTATQMNNGQTSQVMQSADYARKVSTKMGIGSLENKEKMTSTTDLIGSLKKVFTPTELKVIVTCLQKLKQAKEGTKDIQGVLKSLKLAIFKDQKTPSVTDKRFEGKYYCVESLAGFIPPKFRLEFMTYFEPFMTVATAE